MTDAGDLNGAQMQSEFLEFGSWLAHQIGNQRAALSIHKHHTFFKAVDSLWGQFPEPNQLAMQLGVPVLRNARRPLRWLESTKNYTFDTSVMEGLQESERIIRIMAEVPPDAVLAPLVEAYHCHLRSRADKEVLKLRSLRINLRAAVDVVILALSERETRIDQRHVDRILKSKPGVAASLWGFVAFLNMQRPEASPLVMSKRRIEHLRRSRLEKEMIKLASAARAGRDVTHQWIARSLEYFHRQPPGNRTQLVTTSEPEGNGYVVTLAGKSYWVPNPLHLTLLQSFSEN